MYPSSAFAVDVASFFGLRIVLAPNFFANVSIFSSSELNHTSDTPFAFIACDIDQAINGTPQNFFEFFLGIPFEPPLARIIAIVFFIFFLLR